MMAGMTDPSIERERERLDLVIELVEAAILALPRAGSRSRADESGYSRVRA